MSCEGLQQFLRDGRNCVWEEMAKEDWRAIAVALDIVIMQALDNETGWTCNQDAPDGGYPVIVSGADVRDPVYIHWPGEPRPVQYQPVPLGEQWIWPVGDERCDEPKDSCHCMLRKGHEGSHRCAHGAWSGTPTGVERRQA